MKRESLRERLNRIASLFQLRAPTTVEQNRCQMFEMNHWPPLILIGENCDRFQDAIEELLDSWPGIKGTVSQKRAIEKLIPLIREKKAQDAAFDYVEADQFEKAICSLPLQRYRVVRPIYGVDMAQACNPAQLGEFQIDFGRRLLTSRHEDTLLGSVLKPEDQSRLFIQCTVDARDTVVALERADASFYRFEQIFRFFIGHRTQRVEVGIVNHKGAQVRDRFIFSEDGRPVSHGASWEGALQPLILGDPRLPMPSGAMARLFELITQRNSEFEKHILRCAEWTGQAISEPNEAAALVKAAIALEVLFSTNEKGLITPSIMARISECCAFLLGGTVKSAVEIEREVKRLYGIRSSVVHSGKDSVDTKDLAAFIGICRRVVITLLSDKEFSAISSMANFDDYFKRRKYGSKATLNTIN